MQGLLAGLALGLLLQCANPLQAAGSGKKPGIDPAVMTEGFLAAHPDLRWRREGIQAYERGDFDTALAYFKRAARHADKPSQAMVADMYWRGVGVAQDRALGYAWMDLAGERLYPDFIGFREQYWNALDEAERADAIERGQAILAEYADEVAKPRLEKVMRRERRNVTGSRVGFVGSLTIIPMTGPLAGTGMTLSGDQYYAREYWEPRRYWALQDSLWRAPVLGRVRVGDVEQAGPATDGEDADGGE